MRLTIKTIESARLPAGKDRLNLSDDSCSGLVLRISKRSRTWVWRYSINNKLRSITLGPWPTMTIPMARAAADELRLARARGEDPAAVRRKEEVAGLTLDELHDQYRALGSPKANGRPKAAKTISNEVILYGRHVAPAIGRLPIAAISDLHLRRLQRSV